MVRDCHKLSRINEVWMLNLDLREATRNHSTANNFILPNTVAWKHIQRTPNGLRSPQHRKLGFYSPHHRLKKQKNTLKFWPVGSFKAPIRFAFMKIFSLAQSTGDPNTISNNIILYKIKAILFTCVPGSVLAV